MSKGVEVTVKELDKKFAELEISLANILEEEDVPIEIFVPSLKASDMLVNIHKLGEIYRANSAAEIKEDWMRYDALIKDTEYSKSRSKSNLIEKPQMPGSQLSITDFGSAFDFEQAQRKTRNKTKQSKQ